MGERGYPYHGSANSAFESQYGRPVNSMPMSAPMGRPFSCPPGRPAFGPPPVGPPPVGPSRAYMRERQIVPMGGMMIGPPSMGPPPVPSMALISHSPVTSRSALLFSGCDSEAMAANAVVASLDTLRGFLAEELRPPISALIEEMRKCSGVLFQISANGNTHPSRVPVLLDYLELLLPCFQKSLADIRGYYEDKTKTKDIRWRTMYHRMTEEAGGIQLPHIFVLYHQFLLLLAQMLTRNPNFDMNELEILQTRIQQLREKQGLKPPEPTKALVGPAIATLAYQDKSGHWAEDIFSRPLSSRTPLKPQKYSECYGPWLPPKMAPTAKVLFRRSFDNDRLSIIAYIDPDSMSPFLVIRCLDGVNNPIYSTKGVHEVCIERDGNCLVLQRWSFNDRCAKLWALLYFLTWEELVLFHCTFVVLKMDGALTRHLRPGEFNIKREKRLFQATIKDSKFKHSLLVYQDRKTNGLRLHAAVWEGDFRQCPVWTAFVTHQSQSASWLVRKGRHRVWLNDVQLYVFCSEYREEHMRQNKLGAFELNFVAEEAATRFKELFYPVPSETASSVPSTLPSGQLTSPDGSHPEGSHPSESSTSSSGEGEK